MHPLHGCSSRVLHSRPTSIREITEEAYHGGIGGKGRNLAWFVYDVNTTHWFLYLCRWKRCESLSDSSRRLYVASKAVGLILTASPSKTFLVSFLVSRNCSSSAESETRTSRQRDVRRRGQTVHLRLRQTGSGASRDTGSPNAARN